MATPGPFEDKDTLIGEVLQYYRQHTSELTGPTMACTALWPSIRRRIPAALRDELAQIGLAHLVQRHATAGSSPEKGWTGRVSTIKVERVNRGSNGTPQTININVERVAWNGPTEIYPMILVNTIYATEGGSKALIEFTLQDFRYVDQHLESQQFGLAKRQAALRFGARLLRQHGATTVADLEPEVMGLFEQRWVQALNPLPQRKRSSAA
jgi:hypothetical protein